MKKLSDVAWNVTEEQYRADPALSYSTLSRFDREGFANIDKLFDKQETPSLLLGSIVDTILTDGEDEFNNRFVVAEYPDIPDSIIQIVKALFNEFSVTHRTLESIPNEEVIGFASRFNYQNNWKPETRAKVIKEKGNRYYDLLYLTVDKTLVSQDMYNDSLRMVDALRTSEATKWYFADNNPFEPEIERYYQLKFKGEFKGIPIRCMFDELIVLHEEGVIIPVDLKTTKDVITFEDSFFSWRYYIQAQMYAEILKQNLKDDEYFSKFKIEEYRFIAVDKKLLTPIVYNFRNTFGKVPLFYKGTWYRNWRVIIKELHWHLTHKEVKLPYKMYIDYIANNGVLDICKYLNGYLENNYTEPNIPLSEMEWKDVVGYEGYYKVSNTGRVIRLERKVWSPHNNSWSTIPEKLLDLTATKSGLNENAYVQVSLTKDGVNRKHYFVHRLVAEAFIPNPDNLPVVNHIDENGLNNRIDNLEWCTQDYNTNYGNRNTKVSVQLGVAIDQYDLEGNFIASYRSAAEACRQLNLPANRQSNISAVCRGVRKSSLGFIWKFHNDKE